MEQSDLFKQDAKTIVDMFFNNKLFKDNITRDDMNSVEEFVNFLLSSRFDSHHKIQKIMDKIDKRNASIVLGNIPIKSVFIVQGPNREIFGCFDSKEKADRYDQHIAGIETIEIEVK